MLFNSIEFVLFFPTAVAFYFAFPHRFRWVLLLAASYLFYMAWEPGYVVLIWASSLVDYIAALVLGAVTRRGWRRATLGLSIGVNLGLLFFFKYYNFFADTLRPLLEAAGWTIQLPYAHVLLPVGISFYTFQTMSYTIDVYRNHTRPERHLGRFALYVAFFPQLVAGPIERPNNLLPQFLERHEFDYDRITNGLSLMLWGFIKKSVIADRLAIAVESVYANPESQTGPVLALATILFAYQIYCDFSGYTDIALGAAQVMGFRLMDNFRRPYAASSIADFWRRWHISLSTWFRDYLYIPLGGNRVRLARWAVNILIVFLVCGLWHGANWTFVIWGGLHGSYMLFGRLTAPLRDRLAAPVTRRTPWIRNGLRVACTFALVCFAWIFFRADSLADAITIVRRLPFGWTGTFAPDFLPECSAQMGIHAPELLLSLCLIAFLECAQVLQAHLGNLRDALARQPIWLRWSVYSAALWMIFLLGVLRQKEFLYFTF